MKNIYHYLIYITTDVTTSLMPYHVFIKKVLFLLARLSNLDCDASALTPNSQSDFFSCSSADCKARQGACSGEAWRHTHFDILK